MRHQKILNSKRFFPYILPGYWLDVAFAFLLREDAFVFLPLIIVFAVQRYFTDFRWEDFYASTDFSFATVVLLCSGIFQFVELKVRIQFDKSEKLQYGLKVLSILLVLSCVLMTISILKQLHIFSTENPDFLISNFMKGFTMLGLFVIFIKSMEEIKITS
ncbi:hypothetical protein [Leptospira stimsonii]|uniref:Uncharacterized protein n=1 Tax=Leptospira stimsonii TaxID=2202203 RepID=A0ABY2NB79_9LEPT|nr:hypothetical protein [Leptospira stimsonii]TGK17610.1 hypothetical protein EHO98_13915 [Leptospira stimsonii]TGM20255.1 hypothetical protein EHQ90_03605 [Leptospira stimsonii]